MNLRRFLLAKYDRPSVTLGCIALICATFFNSLQDSETKTLIQSYSIWQLVLIRFTSFFVVILSFIVLRYDNFAEVFKSRKPYLQIFRGALLIAEIAFLGMSYKYLGLAEAMTVFHIFPVMGVIFAVVLLDERVSKTTLFGLILGFVGIVVIVGPGSDIHYLGVVLALSSAVCFLLYLVLTRKTSFYDGSLTSLIFVCLCGISLSLVFGWAKLQPIHTDDLWAFVRLCVYNVFGQTCVVLAFSMAPASTLQPLNYVQVFWAVVIGYLVFGDFPSKTTWIGAAMIVSAGMLQLRSVKENCN